MARETQKEHWAKMEAPGAMTAQRWRALFQRQVCIYVLVCHVY